MNATRMLLTAFALSGQVACASSKPVPQPYRVELQAVAADGTPLAGVELSLNGKGAGTTGTDGRLLRNVVGAEGTSLRVAAKCPTDFEAPRELPVLRLTRTKSLGAAEAQPITAQVQCLPSHRHVVLVVKAERGSRLPVLLDGKPVATTDDDGVAHVLLRRPQSDGKVEVSLDTTAQTSLKPVSPSRTYDLGARDALVVFEQSFAPPTPKAPRTPPVRRHIPIRVD